MIKFSLLVCRRRFSARGFTRRRPPDDRHRLQSMHRLGAPDVSPDGRTGGLHHLGHRLDEEQARQHALPASTLRGRARGRSRSQARRKGHDAVFVRRRRAVVPDARRRSGPAVPDAGRRRAAAGQQLQRRHRRVQAVATPATGSSSGPTETSAAPTSTAPACRRPSRRSARAGPTTSCSSATGTRWAEPGVRSRLFAFPVAGGKLARRRRAARQAISSATRRPSRSAAARRSPSRPTAAPSISRFARRAGSRRCRPTSTSSPRPADGSAPPVNLTDANDAHRQSADGFAGRPDARLFRDGAARLRGRPPGADAARPRDRPASAR